MINFPFKQIKIDDSTVIREFSEKTDPIEFMWHRDLEDRMISPTHNTDWLFQFDNELPFIIKDDIFIPAGSFHRLIKGSNNLTLKIKML